MPSKEWLPLQLSYEMSDQGLELPVYFFLQIETKKKQLPWLKEMSPDDSSSDYTTNNLSIFSIFFLNRKNKLKAFKTDYHPFTGFFHKFFLHDTKVKVYFNTVFKITTKEKTYFKMQ